jgi:hypothetical protein
MIRVNRDGHFYACDVCGQPLVRLAEASAVWRPLNGQKDESAEVLLVHQACRDSDLLIALLPQRSKGPLAVVLSQADEALGR